VLRVTRWAALAAVAGSSLIAAATGAARASEVPLTRVTPLRPLTLGFSGGADVALASGDAATQATWVPKAHADGAQVVRLDVAWGTVAPVDPADSFDATDPSEPEYNWSTVDEQARELAAGHFKIMITISGAPTWAEAPGMPKTATPGTWEPNAQDLGEFATAIAARFDGRYPDPLNPGSFLPRVSVWQVWDEPNLPDHLSPQWVQTPQGLVAVSPTVYRNMENAFYTAVKTISKSNYVVLAGLGPYGDDPSASPSERMRPVLFLRALLCETQALKEASGCPGPTYFDAIDSHPYGIYGPNWHAYWPDDVSVPDVYKLVRVLNASEKAGTAMPRGHKGNWVTETSWDTDPPDPGGVPIQEQARWMEQAFYNLWEQGVSTVLWWQIQDSPPIPNYASTYQAGTYYVGGGAKPSSTSFRVPFISFRKNYKTVVVWSRAPASGIMSIQERTDSAWITLARVEVKANEVFELPLDLVFKETLRGKIGRYTSLAWIQRG
jgi:hypothetical protein